MKKIQLLLISSVLFIGVQASFAQNNDIIPNAPASVKIDGKLTEFADSLANYDKTTKVYYAIAHDANNLYVFIKANGQQEQSKIMAGGISVSVNNKGKKKESSTVTFPVVDRVEMMNTMRNGRVEQGNRSGSGASPEKTPAERAAQRAEMRKKMISQFKEIKVSGLNDISVESISIYNTYGIKTGINYNDKNALIYELAIPLRLVNIDLGSADEIAVNIRLNGIELPETGSSGGGGEGRPTGGFGGGGFGGGSFGGGRTGGEAGSVNMMALFTPTEFWVKAKLAK